MTANKIDYNKKMLGKRVSVREGANLWKGQIVEILDEESFRVLEDGGKAHIVNIHDVRSLGYEKV